MSGIWKDVGAVKRDGYATMGGRELEMRAAAVESPAAMEEDEEGEVEEELRNEEKRTREEEVKHEVMK